MRLQLIVRRRAVLPGVVVGALLVLSLARGVPFDRPQVMLWSCALALALAWSHDHDVRLVQLVRDWAPIGLLLTAYDFGRGAADSLGIGTSWTLQARADYWLTGAIPSVWLQHHLYGNTLLHWWNVPFSLLYASHFLVPFFVMAVLWSRAYDRFVVFVRVFLLTTTVGLACFVLHPAAPPWLAAQHRVIDPVDRTAALGWDSLHLHVAQALFDRGAATFNVVAAFPSLHAAYPVVALLVLWPRSGLLFRASLISYAGAMSFMLVLTGEHWVVDVIAGWLVAALSYVAIRAVSRPKR